MITGTFDVLCVQKTVLQDLQATLGQTVDEQTVQKNLIQLNVFYQDLTYEEINQTVGYTVSGKILKPSTYFAVHQRLGLQLFI